MNAGQTILLVDDSENDRLLMRVAFRKAEISMALQEVHGGIEAIAYLNGDDLYGDRNRFPLPVVMLLDLNMPMRNGFDVLAWVRSQTGLKRLSVIVLSASMRPQDIERAFDSGANSFLVKPPSLEGLIEMVRCLQEWIGMNHYPALTPPPGVRDTRRPRVHRNFHRDYATMGVNGNSPLAPARATVPPAQ